MVEPIELIYNEYRSLKKLMFFSQEEFNNRNKVQTRKGEDVDGRDLLLHLACTESSFE